MNNVNNSFEYMIMSSISNNTIIIIIGKTNI